MSTVAILLCAGSGNRMQGKVEDKILAELNGRMVFEHSVVAFEQSNFVSSFIGVFRDAAQRSQLEEHFKACSSKHIQWVSGGAERQDSVLNALEAVPEDTNFVMIHDCARPLVTKEALIELHETMVKDKAAVLAHRVVDTIKQLSSESSQIRQAKLNNLDRRNLWAMETPQAFSWKLILGAYRKLKEDNIQATDDTAAVIEYGYPVSIVENNLANPKITHPEDLAIAELMLQQRSQLS